MTNSEKYFGCLAAHMKSLGMNQEEFAMYLGTDQGQLSRIMRKLLTAGPELLLRFSEKAEIPIKDLVSDYGNDSIKKLVA